MAKKEKLKKLDSTIEQFLEANRKDWQKRMKGVHPDDHIPFYEWLSEFSRELRKEWGIWRDENGNWRYDESNSNWKGDERCECCGEWYDILETGGELCESCMED